MPKEEIQVLLLSVSRFSSQLLQTVLCISIKWHLLFFGVSTINKLVETQKIWGKFVKNQ